MHRNVKTKKTVILSLFPILAFRKAVRLRESRRGKALVDGSQIHHPSEQQHRDVCQWLFSMDFSSPSCNKPTDRRAQFSQECSVCLELTWSKYFCSVLISNEQRAQQ